MVELSAPLSHQLVGGSSKRKTHFFISNAFCNSTKRFLFLNFLINWPSNVASVLLNTYKHHHTETMLIFTICLDLGIFCVHVIYFSFSSSFSLWLIMQSHEYGHTFSFLEYVLLFCKSSTSGYCLLRDNPHIP